VTTSLFVFWFFVWLVSYAAGLWGLLYSETLQDPDAEGDVGKTAFHKTAKQVGVISLLCSIGVLAMIYHHAPHWVVLKIIFVALIISFWMWRISRSLT